MGPRFEAFDPEPDSGRALYLLQADSADRVDLAQIVGCLGRPPVHFIALVALDARGVPDDVISDLGARLIRAGAVCVGTWGPDCERVHDLTDDAYDAATMPTEHDVVVTTWHDDESLADALWFALYTACPTQSFEETCRTVVAIVINSPLWAAEVRRAFSDPQQFSRRVLSHDDESAV